ncbi:MAG: 2-C-methyl-D-erythritol 4-phosphate cytidylyltransferase [Verrucomicrobiae bacterium]|nr:2-C-methyl-D-erythritol 4-phosphate cytidylyltransferase [Verrucomicrobiae bacterium]
MITAGILAAGQSSRMGGGHNKQFLTLRGRPVVWYSLVAFQECAEVDAIVLVRRPDYAAQAETLAREFPKVTAFADGGKERQDSVWNGLEKCDPRTEIVAVQDGARPLVTPELIAATIASARQFGTGIAATKVVDTIKEVRADGVVERTVDRTKLWAVQTPQTCRFDLLRRAYRKVLDEGVVVTDEAAAVERLGEPVRLVPTPFLNLKITTPADFAVVEALLAARAGCELGKPGIAR